MTTAPKQERRHRIDDGVRAEAVAAVLSRVEHADVDPDVCLLLFSQSGRNQRQGGMEAPPDRGVSGVLE